MWILKLLQKHWHAGLRNYRTRSNSLYIKDRNIHESARLIQDMLDILKTPVKKEFCLQLISKKRSTQLTIISCFAVLKKIGFEQTFIAWIKTLLNKTETCIYE